MIELTLPDGRRLALAAEVASRLRCGVLVAAKAQVGAAPELALAMAARAEELRAEHAGRNPAAMPQLQEARRLYRACGIDPTRWRPASEALVRRALKQQTLPRINAAVDAINLASLSFVLPIGLYDLALVEGDVVVRLGRAGEQFAGIRKDMIHLEGRLGLFDAAGAFGSPTSDSMRTAVEAGERALLAVIFATAAYPEAAMTAHLDLMGGLLRHHCGAAIACQAQLWGAT